MFIPLINQKTMLYYIVFNFYCFIQGGKMQEKTKVKNILVPLPKSLYKRLKNLKKEKGVKLRDILLKILNKEQGGGLEKKAEIFRCCVNDPDGQLTELWKIYSKKMKAENKTLREISKEVENYLRYM